MSVTSAAQTNTRNVNTSGSPRRLAAGSEPNILADVYQDDINIAIWQRTLSSTLTDSVNNFLLEDPTFQASITLSPASALSSLNESFGSRSQPELAENIAELLDMFCCLFDLKRAGLRLTSLDQAMCPRFHVDRVPCRLITTYLGVATEWLPHERVDRSKLGPRAKNQSDIQVGLFQQQHDIQQLQAGDVALLKGESWEGNEGAGLVHRSPAVPSGSRRLLLTLDFIS